MERLSKYMVAICQFYAKYGDLETNLERMCQQAETALKQVNDVHLIVFPETATVSLPQMPQSHDQYWKLESYVMQAETIDGPTSTALGKIAKVHQAYIATGFVEKDPNMTGVIYNSSMLIGPDGEIVATHRKVQSGGVFKSGSQVEVHDTAIGKLGMSICYDLWFPEFMRIQVRNGCEVHINMTANQPIFSIGSTHVPIVRAVESGVFVLSANLVGDDRPNGGKAHMGSSSIINPFGEVIAMAGQQEEEIIFGEIDLAQIARTRTLISTIKDIRSDVYEVIYHSPDR